MRPSFPLLEPPLGVWGVFGGAKTPKHQLKTELETHNTQILKTATYLSIDHYKPLRLSCLAQRSISSNSSKSG
jgi:hypothetical protein